MATVELLKLAPPAALTVDDRPMLDEREFFIRKAIGWVLRDTSRRRPELVADWIEPRVARASGVTVREAVKHLDPERRARIMEANATSR